MPIANRFRMVTSTATVCIFDPQRLRHRLDDAPDWWSIVSEEIKELNQGNAMIVGLGSDGAYSVQVHVGGDEAERGMVESVTALIGIESGSASVGPGEEITGGGFEPSTLQDGCGAFIDLEPGAYHVTVAMRGDAELTVVFRKVQGVASNSISDQLLLGDF